MSAISRSLHTIPAETPVLLFQGVRRDKASELPLVDAASAHDADAVARHGHERRWRPARRLPRHEREMTVAQSVGEARCDRIARQAWRLPGEIGARRGESGAKGLDNS